MISGGVLQSPSISTTASPVAISMPLRKADCEPKLREWLIPTTFGSWSHSPSMTSS